MSVVMSGVWVISQLGRCQMADGPILQQGSDVKVSAMSVVMSGVWVISQLGRCVPSWQQGF